MPCLDSNVQNSGPLSEVEPSECGTRTVVLSGLASRACGLVLASPPTGCGVYIPHVIRDGLAYHTGLCYIGDQVVAIDGVDTSNWNSGLRV